MRPLSIADSPAFHPAPFLWAPVQSVACTFIGLARTEYIRIYTPYIWWFPSQKYRMYTVYIWFWPNLHIYETRSWRRCSHSDSWHRCIAKKFVEEHDRDSRVLSDIIPNILAGSCRFLHICRVGQNRIYTPYMTVCMVICLPNIPYIHRIYQ